MTTDDIRRLGLFLAILEHDAALYRLLWLRGGGHPKDIALAHLCVKYAAALRQLFPELEA